MASSSESINSKLENMSQSNKAAKEKVTVLCTTPKPQRLGFAAQLGHLSAAYPGATKSLSLCLSFPIRKFVKYYLPQSIDARIK